MNEPSRTTTDDHHVHITAFGRASGRASGLDRNEGGEEGRPQGRYKRFALLPAPLQGTHHAVFRATSLRASPTSLFIPLHLRLRLLFACTRAQRGQQSRHGHFINGARLRRRRDGFEDLAVAGVCNVQRLGFSRGPGQERIDPLEGMSDASGPLDLLRGHLVGDHQAKHQA
eukprot:scaffold4719_cov314-Pinguiococcus_pyrenoidosus.AAC.4